MKKLVSLLLVLVLALCAVPLAAAAADAVVYLDNVAGSDANDGMSAAAPKKTFGSLSGKGSLGKVRNGGTIVVVGKAWVAKDWTLPKAGGAITFTAAYGGKDYKDATPETNPNTSFKMASGVALTIESDVIFDDIILFQENKQNTIAVTDGATLTITDKAVLMSKPGKDYHFRILLEDGATAILSEEAQKVMDIGGSGGKVLTYMGEGKEPVESDIQPGKEEEKPQTAVELAYLDSGAGNDANDGLSAAAPKKTFGTLSGKGLLGLLPAGGKAVVVGKAYVARDWTMPTLSGELVFTSNDGTKDYKNAEPMTNPACAFKMASGATLTIASDVRFEDIILFQENKQNTIHVTTGATLVVTDTVVLMSKPGVDYHFKVVIDEGATAILSEAAQNAMTVESDGTLLTYASGKPAENPFKPTRGYENAFADVTNDKWFYTYVKTAYEYALANGTSATAFSPDSSFTVAQALTAAANIHKAYTAGTIDTAGAKNWYDPYVSYCIENGIIKEGQFADYGKNITRGDMAVVFVSILPESEYKAIREKNLPDVTEDMPCAAAVRKLANAGIVGGDNKGNYNAANEITRAEACVIFTRIAVASMRDGK